jgi:hypothetical protein
VGIADGILTNLIPIVYMTGIEDGWVCDVELAKNIILAHSVHQDTTLAQSTEINPWMIG